MDKITKLNLGAGKVIKEGYINTDLRALPGIDKVFNAFIVPWPFEDETFDEIHMSHLVEHIPHTMRRMKRIKQINPSIIEENNGPKFLEVIEPLWDEDGFFTFFRECWRILKMGGTIEIIGPYHRSIGADQDPTHTRYITETTFSYLWQWSETFDYQLDFKFEQTSFGLVYNQQIEELIRRPDIMSNPVHAGNLQEKIMTGWNIAHSFHTVLKKCPTDSN